MKKTHSKQNQIDNAKNFLQTQFGIHEGDIRFVDFRTLKFGNVIFQHDTSSSVENIRAWLSDRSIQTCGRFGEWAYLWSNQAFLSGLNALSK